MLRWVRDRTAVDRRDGVEAVLERGHDAEVAAPAPQPPQEVRIFRGARPHGASVGRDDVGGDQVVAREPETTHEPAQAATERETGDAGRRHRAHGRREPERLGRRVEIAERAATAGARDATDGIDLHAPHGRAVDHEATVARRLAGEAVAAAAHGHREALCAREQDCAHHVGGIGAAHDGGRPAIDRCIPDRPRVLVPFVRRQDQRAVELRAQSREFVRHLA